MWLSDVSIRRPVFAVMIIMGLVVLGWISLGRLGVDLFPKVEFPTVIVSTQLDGASPEAIESDVTDPIEEQVNTTSGIDELTSTSFEGMSRVVLQYKLGENVDAKAQDVREKVAAARADLPDDTEPSVVQKVDPDAQPIMSIMIAGDLPIRDLTHFADKTAKEQLQRIAGVGSITLVGGRMREVRIWLDAAKMRAYGIAADDVTNAIRREHAEIPGGRLDTAGNRSELAVKTKGEVDSVQAFGDIVVAFRPDGAATHIRDIARVEDGMADERSYAELDGRQGISLDIRKQSGQNTVEVARAIRAALPDLRKRAPDGVKLQIARDMALFIEAASRDVFTDIKIGIGLVVLVTLAFLLSLRATLIVAIAMPTSLIATFFSFYLAGFTINLMTLMALSMAVGLLVDDAIVVLESIYRKLERGLPPMQAASEGTREVGLAVLAATFSVCAVFVPIAFITGIVGQFFYQYGLAIAFSVLVSLLVSLTLTPMLSARLLKRDDTEPGNYNRVARAIDAAYRRLDGFYGRVLAFALDRRWTVMGIALATVAFGFLVARTIPSAFDVHNDRAEFLATVELPLGTGLAETRAIARRAAHAMHGVGEVRTVFFTIGADAQAEVNRAEFYVGITPKNERAVKDLAVMDEIRTLLTRILPEAKHISLGEVPWIASGGGWTDYALIYTITGPDLAVLEAKANEALAEMRRSPLFADPKTSYDSGKPELQVHIDRKRAADLGVPVAALAQTVRTMIGGVKAGSYEEMGQRYDVRVRLAENERDDIAKLAMIQVRGNDGRLIGIGNVARFDVAAGPAQIEHENRARRVAILANLPAGISLGPATEKLEAIMRGIAFPPGYDWSVQGKAKSLKDTGEAIVFAFALAFIALYMILASQFNSFVQPAIIMLSAPLSFSGAFLVLKLSGHDFSMFAQIGLLALMGLVMKNGILLVDYANQLVAGGAGVREALVRAGPVRLRPVLMTQIATVFGMIPVALSTSQGAEVRNAMGYVAIGGLVSSTLLTLVVVPVAYSLTAGARARTVRLARRLRTLAARHGIGTAPETGDGATGAPAGQV